MCEHTFPHTPFWYYQPTRGRTQKGRKEKKSVRSLPTSFLQGTMTIALNRSQHAPCSAPCLSAVTSTTQEEDIQHQHHHHNQHSLSHGPCTPPTSPNPDLVFKSSTLVNQQQSSEYIAPSTPPPSRSSTVKRSIPMNTTHTTNNHPSRKFPEPSTTTTGGSKLLADVQITTPEQVATAATTSNHHDTTTNNDDHPLCNKENGSDNQAAAATTTIFDPLHPLAHDNEPSTTAPVNIPQKPIRDSDSGRHTFTQSINNYRRASLRSSMSMRRARQSSILDLDPEEQAALKVEIASRRAARRASTRKRRTYADTDDEDDHQDHIRIGTRIAEGHRNYQLM